MVNTEVRRAPAAAWLSLVARLRINAVAQNIERVDLEPKITERPDSVRHLKPEPRDANAKILPPKTDLDMSLPQIGRRDTKADWAIAARKGPRIWVLPEARKHPSPPMRGILREKRFGRSDSGEAAPNARCRRARLKVQPLDCTIANQGGGTNKRDSNETPKPPGLYNGRPARLSTQRPAMRFGPYLSNVDRKAQKRGSQIKFYRRR